ncbi:MAG: substrate-binding domain-containing protein [Acidimicrobiia bacterium]
MRKPTNVWVLALVVLGLVAAGCSSDSSNRSKSTTTTTTAKATGTIKVSDAASLTEAFAKIGTDFKAANPGAIVTFNPGSSTTLATQIQQTNGVGIDTFASADEANMDNLVRARLIDGEPVVFATKSSSS